MHPSLTSHNSSFLCKSVISKRFEHQSGFKQHCSMEAPVLRADFVHQHSVCCRTRPLVRKALQASSQRERPTVPAIALTEDDSQPSVICSNGLVSCRNFAAASCSRMHTTWLHLRSCINEHVKGGFSARHSAEISTQNYWLGRLQPAIAFSTSSFS